MEAKQRAYAIVLKRALLEQKDIVKSLESATMPTTQFIQTLQATIILAERPLDFVLDFICKFLCALFEDCELKELDCLARSRRIKLYLLQSMKKMKDRDGIKGLELVQDLVIQVSGIVSLIELGLEDSAGMTKIKRNLIYLILESESFIEKIPEFYSSSKMYTTRESVKKCDIVTSGINLLNHSFALSVDQAPAAAPNGPILVEQSTQSDAQVIKEEEDGPDVIVGRQESLLRQYSQTIQLLTAKLASPIPAVQERNGQTVSFVLKIRG